MFPSIPTYCIAELIDIVMLVEEIRSIHIEEAAHVDIRQLRCHYPREVRSKARELAGILLRHIRIHTTNSHTELIQQGGAERMGRLSPPVLKTRPLTPGSIGSNFSPPAPDSSLT